MYNHHEKFENDRQILYSLINKRLEQTIKGITKDTTLLELMDRLDAKNKLIKELNNKIKIAPSELIAKRELIKNFGYLIDPREKDYERYYVPKEIFGLSYFDFSYDKENNVFNNYNRPAERGEKKVDFKFLVALELINGKNPTIEKYLVYLFTVSFYTEVYNENSDLLFQQLHLIANSAASVYILTEIQNEIKVLEARGLDNAASDNEGITPLIEKPKVLKRGNETTHKQQIILLKELGFFDLPLVADLSIENRAKLIAKIINKDWTNGEHYERYYGIDKLKVPKDDYFVKTEINLKFVNNLFIELGIKKKVE